MAKKQRKLPIGWKPGETPEFKPHRSIVRHRDTDVKTVMGMGYLDGDTHARFIANPHCCDKCSKMDGTIRRLSTSINWIYVLVHPNCLCHWETGRMVNKKFITTKSHHGIGRFQDSERTYIFKARPGMVLKDVTVTRNGKTFKQRRWVKESSTDEKSGKNKYPDRVDQKKGKDTSNAPPPPPKKQKKPESGSTGPKLDEKHTEKLKEISDVLNSQPVGKEHKIGPAAVPVVNFDKGHFGVTIHGRRLIGVGAASAAALVYFATVLTSTVAAAASGDFSGKSMDEAKKIGQSVKAKGAQVKERMIEQKPERQ